MAAAEEEMSQLSQTDTGYSEQTNTGYSEQEYRILLDSATGMETETGEETILLGFDSAAPPAASLEDEESGDVVQKSQSIPSAHPKRHVGPRRRVAAAEASALAFVLVAVVLWCRKRKSESNSPPGDSEGEDKRKDDDQVNETSSTEIEEITVGELKYFYEICQSENKSADDTFKESEKRILAQPDPKKYVTEQLDEKLAKIQEDLRDTKEKLKEIAVEIEESDDKKLIIERTKAEKKRDELEKERNALEKERKVGKLFKEVIFKPTIDLQTMIHLCNMKIEKMSAAHKTQEKEAFEWVKTVLVRKEEERKRQQLLGESSSPGKSLTSRPDDSYRSRLDAQSHMNSDPWDPTLKSDSVARTAKAMFVAFLQVLTVKLIFAFPAVKIKKMLDKMEREDAASPEKKSDRKREKKKEELKQKLEFLQKTESGVINTVLMLSGSGNVLNNQQIMLVKGMANLVVRRILRANDEAEVIAAGSEAAKEGARQLTQKFAELLGKDQSKKLKQSLDQMADSYSSLVQSEFRETELSKEFRTYVDRCDPETFQPSAESCQKLAALLRALESR